MQATIFVRPEALQTLEVIRPLDYYERVSLSDETGQDLTSAPGYFLNTAALRIAGLPANSSIVLSLTPEQGDVYHQIVTVPDDLRGVVYAGAAHLPPDYANIIKYWSPLTVSGFHRNAVYYQNAHQAYLVQMAVIDGEDPEDPFAERMPADELLTDGVVFCLRGLGMQLEECDPQHFVEVYLPIDPIILGIEHDGLKASSEYRFDAPCQWDRIYLRVADIMASPNPNLIAISALRSEFGDYGFVY
jgi:hypothetical protein